MTPIAPARREKDRRPLLAVTLAVLWTTALLASLLVSGDRLGDLEAGLHGFLWFENLEMSSLDKIAHALLFAGETFFLCLCLRTLAHDRPLTMAVFFASLLACLTEVGQLAIPHRHADWADLAANQTGIMVTSLLILVSSQHNTKGSHS